MIHLFDHWFFYGVGALILWVVVTELPYIGGLRKTVFLTVLLLGMVYVFTLALYFTSRFLFPC